MRNDCLSAALQELESAGIRDIEHANGGKHLQIRWSINGGARRLYTIPVTPSDWRAPRNARAAIRRMLREDGVITPPLKTPDPVAPRKLDRLTLVEQKVALLERRLTAIEQALLKMNKPTGNGRAGDIA